MAICEKNLIADGTQSNQGHFLELIDGFFFFFFCLTRTIIIDITKLKMVLQVW
jgi:hypothetical protein